MIAASTAIQGDNCRFNRGIGAQQLSPYMSYVNHQRRGLVDTHPRNDFATARGPYDYQPKLNESSRYRTSAMNQGLRNQGPYSYQHQSNGLAEDILSGLSGVGPGNNLTGRYRHQGDGRRGHTSRDLPGPGPQSYAASHCQSQAQRNRSEIAMVNLMGGGLGRQITGQNQYQGNRLNETPSRDALGARELPRDTNRYQ